MNTPKETVAALVGALERIETLSRQVWDDMQGRLADDEHRRAHRALFRLYEEANSALALYRGESI